MILYSIVCISTCLHVQYFMRLYVLIGYCIGWLLINIKLALPFFFIIVILLTRPSLQIIFSVGKMMPRRWASGRKSILPQQKHKMGKFELHLRILFPGARRKQLTCRRSLTNFITKAFVVYRIRVITKVPNSEQSNKGKVKTHKYINRQNQSTTGKLWKRNDPD